MGYKPEGTACDTGPEGGMSAPGRWWGGSRRVKQGLAEAVASSFEALPTAHLPLPFVGPSGQRDSLHLDRGLFFSDHTHPLGDPRSEVLSNGLSWGSSF